MAEWNERTVLLIGDKGFSRLQKAHVLIAGLGGVGAYVAEMLCRAGVGQLTIVDRDVVSASNKNRQLIALDSTLGEPKSKLMAQRLNDINPEVKLNVIHDYLIDDKIEILFSSNKFDYVVDAIDTIAPKVFFLFTALKYNQRIISAMGAGGKLDPSKVKIDQIENSTQCKLAFLIRKRLHKLGVRTGFKVIYSTEVVPKDAIKMNEVIEQNKLTTVGTISYMPAIFGCFAASVVINDLIADA
ncbi:MAG: tRNA threonylcarbamoyladenosine dehydratase [Bacteroidota bacterium]